MIRTLSSTLLSFIMLAGCSSDGRQKPPSMAESDSTPESFDPFGGDYPQIMWMCNVYEVPAGTEIASDGSVRASTSAKPNGVGVVGGANTAQVLDSIRAVPGARHLGTPVCFARPEAEARIEPRSRDKAGGSIGDRSLMLTAEPVGDHVRATAEMATTHGAFATSCRCGARDIPADGALLLVCAGGDANQPWTLLVARPTILRSAADFPYQRASSFSINRETR